MFPKFAVTCVPDGDVLVFCQSCGSSTFLYDMSFRGIVDVKRWMYHHIVDSHRLYDYMRQYKYPSY